MTQKEYEKLKVKIEERLQSEQSFKDAYELFNMMVKRQKYLFSKRRKKQ